jgi:DNA-binding transcriptional MocR family regulator
LRARIEGATVAVLRDLERVGVRIFAPPSGGFYQWALLPPGTDEADLARRASEQSIFMAPGAVFAPDRIAGKPAIRINVAYASDQRFLEFLAGYLG